MVRMLFEKKKVHFSRRFKIAGMFLVKKSSPREFFYVDKGFGAGVIVCLRTCVFLQLLLDLPRERNIWLNCPE